MTLPEAVKQALTLAHEWAMTTAQKSWTAANAVAYINEVWSLRDKIPPCIPFNDALQTQLLYVRSNLVGWRGPTAVQAKRIIDEYIRSLD